MPGRKGPEKLKKAANNRGLRGRNLLVGVANHARFLLPCSTERGSSSDAAANRGGKR